MRVTVSRNTHFVARLRLFQGVRPSFPAKRSAQKDTGHYPSLPAIFLAGDCNFTSEARPEHTLNMLAPESHIELRRGLAQHVAFARARAAQPCTLCASSARVPTKLLCCSLVACAPCCALLWSCDELPKAAGPGCYCPTVQRHPVSSHRSSAWWRSTPVNVCTSRRRWAASQFDGSSASHPS